MDFFTYDLETFSNCFLFAGQFFDDDKFQIFEISARVNQRAELLQFLGYLQNRGSLMVGFNSESFDYPILHSLLTEPYVFDAPKAHALAQTIINTQDYAMNPNRISMRQRILPQVDLVKVNHFDNAMKRTSLKSLQFAMRSESVEDLPFHHDTILNAEQMDVLRSYCCHDVTETKLFLKKCLPNIQMRKDLLDHGVISGDVLNYSDVKIGTEYLISKIGRGKCFLSPGKPRTTQRSSVAFKDIILPKIHFQTQPFDQVLQWFKAQTLYMGRKGSPSLSAKLGGIDFDFGVGGVHASVEKRSYSSSEEKIICDVDVGGMYPSIACANGFYPEHLGQSFVSAYTQLQRDRAQYPKGSMMNLVMKLANNGVFGNSNNMYSPFYDPKFTFSITINGQLQLLQLAEMFSRIPGIELIQANTDGITALVPQSVYSFFRLWCNEWECLTGLKLEHNQFKHMFIRDVNNYIAVDMKGKIKRKGAYWYPLCDEDYHGSSGSNWSKDFSNLTAQKGVEACMLHGFGSQEVVRCITDPFDFMLRYKARGSDKVFIGDKEQLKTTRYYVSKSGQPMKKVASPKGIIGQYKRKNSITDELYAQVRREIGPDVWDPRIHNQKKTKYEMVTTGIESGWLVKECNNVRSFDWGDVDFDYYAAEVQKLLIER